MMARRRPGDKPLSEPMMVCLLSYICVSIGLDGLVGLLAANVSVVQFKSQHFLNQKANLQMSFENGW